jgi:hypothetical protein
MVLRVKSYGSICLSIGNKPYLADKIKVLSGFKVSPYAFVFWNIGEGEYISLAGAGLSNFDLVQLSNTILAICYKYIKI